LASNWPRPKRCAQSDASFDRAVEQRVETLRQCGKIGVNAKREPVGPVDSQDLPKLKARQDRRPAGRGRQPGRLPQSKDP